MAYARVIGVCRITPCAPSKGIRQLLCQYWNSFRNLPTCRNLSRSSPGLASQISSSEIPELTDLEGKGFHFNTHQELYNFSLQNPDAFWSTFARSRLKWAYDFHETSDCNFVEGKVNWFSGGKLNVSVNCVDRHKDANPNNVALIWEKDEPGQEEKITYQKLYEMTNQLANALLANGVKRGDRVAVYMPVSPITVAAMLACARIGAIHSVVFAGFSADALGSRIRDAGAETIITTDQGVRGGKIIELKKTVNAALEQCPGVKRVFVAQRTGNQVPSHKLDIPLEQAMATQSTECPPEIMDANDHLFMLYTSGSTGSPKGLIHAQAGYLLHAMMAHKFVFDYRPGDIYACVADVGWITGHSFVVYGPLCNGATSILFESVPTYPDPGKEVKFITVANTAAAAEVIAIGDASYGVQYLYKRRYWEMVERLRVNQIYLAPTALRLLLKAGDKYVKGYDRSSLRTLGCVGEPLNHEAWEWYHDIVGEKRCDLVDTWWQTETGAICISPRPSAPGAEIRHGPMRPFFGINPQLLNEQKQEIQGNDVSGALCIKQPWPGLARTIYGNHERFIATYLKDFPGYYCTGDGAYRDADGYYHITGRMDDVINVTGHRLGTAEVEDAMDEHDAVAEAAVVGFPHDIKGEGVYAYVILKDGVNESEDQIIAELKSLTKKKIAGYAVPEVVQITPGLPKTRSGKIMRRILRKICAGEKDSLGDISTLADPSIVQTLIEKHEKLTEQQ